MNRRIGALKPPIELHELLFIEPTRANLLRLSWNSGSGIIEEPEAAQRCPSVIVLRFHAPAIGSVHIAADVVGHCLLTAPVYRGITSTISSASISRAGLFRPSVSAILLRPFSVSFQERFPACLRY